MSKPATSARENVDARGPRPSLPGDAGRARRTEEMLRVDHAGEHGAVAIYRGQLAVFGKLPGKRRIARQLEEMAEHEQEHLDAFDALLLERRVRPTALAPLADAAGFALGVATALMGERAAHACTEAVETVIEEHYGDQVEELRTLGGEEALADQFAQFQAEEAEHKHIAIEGGAREAVGYPVLSGLIKLGCRAAIKVCEKV